MSKIVIAFVFTYIAGLFASLFVEVSWGIYLYQIDYFVNPRVRWWYGILPHFRYSLIIAICVLFSYFIHSKKYVENRIFDLPQTKWFLVNWIVFALIFLWAVWPEQHQKTLILHSKLLVLMIIAYKVIDSSEKFEKMILTFLFGNFYISWVARNFGRNSMGRLEGIGPSDSGDANACAAILISVLPLLIYYLSNTKQWWKKLIFGLILAYVMNAVILINSRGAFVGAAVSICYFVVFVSFNKGSSFKQRVLILMSIIAGLGLFLYLSDIVFWERVATLGGTSAENQNSGTSRIFFWQTAWELVKDYPLGIGTWGFQYLSPQLLPAEMLSEGRRAVHSTYFQCLVERGYFGMFIFMGIVVSNFRLMRKAKTFLMNTNQIGLFQQGIAIEAGFIAFLTAAMFINRLHAEILYWWMLIICCFCNIYYFKKARKLYEI